MSGRDAPCPGCPGQELMPPGFLEGLIAEKKGSGEPVVDDIIYERRLAVCGACAECLNGLMCRMCGCIVPYRALDTDKGCPHPDGDRWSAASPNEA